MVDDEPCVRMLVTEVLEDLGCTAIGAADGAAGLKVLKSDTRIDLLVHTHFQEVLSGGQKPAPLKAAAAGA